MNLTNFQKELCIKIRDNQITNLVDFIIDSKFFGEPTPECDQLINLYLSSTIINTDLQKLTPELNNLGQCVLRSLKFPSHQILSKMSEFAALWGILENNGYIISITANYLAEIEVPDEMKTVPPNSKYGEFHVVTLFNLTELCLMFKSIFSYNGFNKKGILTMSSLNEFIENGYKTKNELESEINHNYTKWAIGISGLLAFASLVVSLFAVFKEPSRQPVEIINLDSAMEKYSRAAVVRARYEDSLSKAYRAPRDTSFARVGKKISK
ncbi:MAG: hypothetical protein ACM3U1_10450 [Chloroflexota bacterium]